MTALTELVVSGEWTQAAKSALAQGLMEQAKVCSLQKICLCANVNTVNVVYRNEFQELWDAIFSLPQLSNLEVVIRGRRLLQAMKNCEHLIYESWKNTASGRQLKAISLAIYSKRKLAVH